MRLFCERIYVSIYKILTLIEKPKVNYAPEPCELVLRSLFVAKNHTMAPLCLDLVPARVLPPFFHYNEAQGMGSLPAMGIGD